MVLDTSLLNLQQYKVHIKGKMVPELDYIAPLFVWFFESHTEWNNAQCVITLLWYNKPRLVPTIAWTLLVAWDTRHKLACNKILQNFDSP